jgi:hypothetical protein
MPLTDLAQWAVEYNNENPDDPLLRGILMLSSLSPSKYTMWRGDIYER